MFANEAKACFYELFRDHVELFYKGNGWPADPDNWAPMFRERDALFVNDERNPPAGDEPGIRYGTTYGRARGTTERMPGQTTLVPLWIGIHQTPEHAAGWWMLNRWADGEYWNRLRIVLAREGYAEALKEELRNAFHGIENFNVGVRLGKKVMDSLRKDEWGQKAIATWERNRAMFQLGIDALLNEPFGIDRDFTHLSHTALLAFAHELQKDPPSLAEIFPMRAEHHWRTYHMPDTFGTTPVSVYDDASKDPNGGASHFQLARWVPLYLERVRTVARRWSDNGEHAEVERRLGMLAEEVRGQTMALLIGDGTPKGKTGAEAALWKVRDGITALKEQFQDKGNTIVRDRASTTTTTHSETGAWLYLKNLALFYAYRWEHEKNAVDFVSVDAANYIAQQAGFTKPSSGKTLLDHYRCYTSGDPDTRRIERTKEGTRPGDILNRFKLVLERLASYPESLVIAEMEYRIVRARSNRTED